MTKFSKNKPHSNSYSFLLLDFPISMFFRHVHDSNQEHAYVFSGSKKSNYTRKLILTASYESQDLRNGD